MAGRGAEGRADKKRQPGKKGGHAKYLVPGMRVTLELKNPDLMRVSVSDLEWLVIMGSKAADDLITQG